MTDATETGNPPLPPGPAAPHKDDEDARGAHIKKG